MAEVRRSRLGALIEQCMKDAGNMAQGTLGQLMGVSQPQIGRWLTGDGEPSFEERLRLARTFKQPLWHFLSPEQRSGVGGLLAELVREDDPIGAVRRALAGSPNIDEQELASIREAFDQLLRREMGCSLGDMDALEQAEMLEKLRRLGRSAG